MDAAQVPQTAARADQLAKALSEVAAAIDQARSVGLPVDVPDRLYYACLEIIARHNGSDPPTGCHQPQSPYGDHSSPTAQAVASLDRAARHGRPPTRDQASVHDVPLRRLLWQVLNPGEEFTVNVVVQRLADIGVHSPANKVSNALGYWVSRGRLNRRRKGVYLYPVIPNPLKDTHIAESTQTASARGRAEARRKGMSNDSVNESKRQAM